jgi:hypothetical protein
MTLEEQHESVLVDAFIDCNQTVVDVWLSSKFPEVVFREWGTGVIGMAGNLTRIY